MNGSISGLYRDISTDNELRLDVDGHFPLQVASGTFNSFTSSIHWIAEDLNKTDSLSWQSGISYKRPNDVSFPYLTVRINVTIPSSGSSNPAASVVFSGPGLSDLIVTYAFISPHFHAMEFEYDVEEGLEAVTSIETHAHPDRPATLEDETLTIETVYERAGFDVKVSSDSGSEIPITRATTSGEDLEDQGLWDDAEMHDAMQSFWSRFDESAQWAMWVFFAGLHEADDPTFFDPDPPPPEALGGIMFDDIGPNHRQGTAIFNNSFIANPPPSDSSPEAWIRRMRFWTAVHEMGHAFNLAHAWQKNLGNAWKPQSEGYDLLSFMNYPYLYQTGGFSQANTIRFFRDFEFRFSEDELLFMRHAPEDFVQMGNADWFDNHAFRNTNISPAPPLRLGLRVNRPNPEFEFLEPVCLELKLTNESSQIQLVDTHILSNLEEMVVIIKKDNKPARQFIPFARHCWQSHKSILRPGESAYSSLFVSAGLNGWDIAEPGYYTVQIAIEYAHQEEIVSNPLRIRVAPPRGYEEEYIAQDYFCDDVGRILTFDGSLFLSKGNDTLHEVVERLNDRRVAIHAEVALGAPLIRNFKQLVIDDNTNTMKINTHKADSEGARNYLSKALLKNRELSAETLGHVDFKYYTDRYSDFLATHGASSEAIKIQENLGQTLSKRGVAKKVVDQCRKKAKSYKSTK